jgi:hypothetical protein
MKPPARTKPSHDPPDASAGVDSELGRLMLLGSIAFLGRAILENNGAYSPSAIRWVAAAFVLALAPIVVPRIASLERFVRGRLLLLSFGTAIAFQFALVATTSPAIYIQLGPGIELSDFQFLLAVSAVVSGVALASTRLHVPLYAPLVVVAYVALGVWTLRASPNPHIDVFPIHQQAADALLHGKNPYALTFANMYHSTMWYAPGTATTDQLKFGYVYPAWSLLVALPGYVLAHDYRYAYLAASAVCAMLMVHSGRARWATAAAVLFLFNPRSFLVLEQGWTEPALLLGITVAVFAATRRMYNLLAVGLGIVLVGKQYSVLAAPVALLVRPLFPSWRAYFVMLLKALFVGALLTLPFVLWNAKAFWHDVYGIQFTVPFRPDSLSFPVAWQERFGSPMPRILQLGLPLLLGVLVVVRARRTPAGLAWAGGTLYLVFFLFRQGFCNYFYLVIGVYCLAIAAHRTAPMRPAALRGT